MWSERPESRRDIDTGWRPPEPKNAGIEAVKTSSQNGTTSQARVSRALLEQYGLRATRQRLGLAKLLFGKGERHVTADLLASEANEAKLSASLATVYNALNLFAGVGLLRSLAIDSSKTVFDTNTSDHGHFYVEETGEIRDIADVACRLCADIEPPEGFEITRVDVVVRLRRKTSDAEPQETKTARLID